MTRTLLRKAIGYALSVLLTIPFSIGLPILFFWLWLQAVHAAGTGGGMFYAPKTVAELVWQLGYSVIAIPFFLSMLLGLIIAGLLTYGWTLLFPTSQLFSELAYPRPFFMIIVALSIIVQALTWGTLTHWTHIALKRAYHYMFNNSETENKPS